MIEGLNEELRMIELRIGASPSSKFRRSSNNPTDPTNPTAPTYFIEKQRGRIIGKRSDQKAKRSINQKQNIKT